MPNRKDTSGPNPLIVISHVQFKNIQSINIIATMNPVVGKTTVCLGHKKDPLHVKILLKQHN